MKVVDFWQQPGEGQKSRTALFGGIYQVTDTPAGPGRELYYHADARAVARKSELREREDGVIVVHREMHYLHAGALDSSDTVTDEVAQVVQRNSYTPYGQRRDPHNWQTTDAYENPLALNIGFAGSEEQLGKWIAMGVRHYDPANLTFVSPDPLSVPKTTQGYNPYAYSLHRPLNLRDPTGMMPVEDYNSVLLAVPGWIGHDPFGRTLRKRR